jgi:hypothetical protein
MKIPLFLPSSHRTTTADTSFFRQRGGGFVEKEMLESRQKIEIPLKTIAGLEHKKLGTNIRQTIENEYATKYLERIGVQPTKEKIEFMLSSMPVEV